ncbi:MAG: hypothetical protein J7518_08910 [Nocardioidaceae bacterium]|nr:hypothetical protein [Nocardioidaceae bacterium]
MKVVAAVAAFALAVFLATTQPDLLLFLLAGAAFLLAGAFLVVGVGRTFEWLSQLGRR